MPQLGEYRGDGSKTRWSGKDYEWQSEESYAKLEKDNAFSRPWWWHLTPDGIGNFSEFLVDQAQEINERTGRQGRASIGTFGLNVYQKDGETTLAPGNAAPISQQAAYGGTVGVAKNLLELGAAAELKATAPFVEGRSIIDPVDPMESRGMGAVQAVDEFLRQAPGLEQEYDRPPEAAVFENLGAEATTSTVGAVLGAKLVPGTAFTNGVFSRLSPQLQKSLRWISGLGTESFVSTIGMADQNLDGNLSNAITPNGPFSVQPGDDIFTATAKSLVPNAAAEMFLGGVVDGLGKGWSVTAPNIAQRIRQGRVAERVKGARSWLEESGIETRPDPTVDRWQFIDENPYEWEPAADTAGTTTTPAADTAGTAATPEPKAEPKPETPAEPLTQKAAEDMLVGAEPEPVDFTAPEVETVVIAAEELGDEQLKALDATEGPVLDALEEQLQGVAYAERIPVSEAGALIRNDVLAKPQVPFAEQWAQLPNERLLGLADPAASPTLFQKINDLTGKPYDEFTRTDVLDGLAAMQADGYTLVPNRVMDDNVMAVGDIQVDPQRFQFKDGVDESGQQVGNSLTGVERWNPDAEGEISVWQDRVDGNTYVVNGHNRLAKAKELGIPSIRVRQILAGDDAGARAMGAIENISSGGGTVFDAAKFIREAGIESPEALEAAGIPIQSGTGAQGLAISKLPDTLFQDAINGDLSVNRAAKLGGSGLDDETMIRVARMGENMSSRGFAELVDMARTAPKVESDQMGLFGAEMVDTMTIKAELAGKVKAALTQNKNLMAKVSKKQAAEQLAGVGTEVNVSAAQLRADLVRGLVSQFDADKYMTGTAISEMLNQGTAEIAGGAKQAAVAKNVVEQLARASEAEPPAPVPAATAGTVATPEPAPDAPLSAAERDAVKKRVVKRAIENGEVRPSATPIPELPDPPSDLTDPRQVLQDELRLAGDYDRQQRANDWAATQSHRETIGYDDMPLQEKKANGMLDGLEEPKPATPEPTRQVEFTLPQSVAKSAPRFGSVRLKFESDLDKAAYIIRNKTKKSKGEPAIVKALIDQGINVSEVQRLGNDIKTMIQDAVEAQTGSRRAPQGVDIEIEIPASTRDAEELQPTAEGNAALEYQDQIKRAMRPVSAKTQSRLEGAAQAYAKYTGTSVEQARTLVGRKQAVFDPDKVDGLDMDQARNDIAMGKRTPAVEAAADAYRAAYPNNTNYDFAAEVPEREYWSWLDSGRIPDYKQDPQALRQDLEALMERVGGKPKQTLIKDEPVMVPKGKEWGGDGSLAAVNGWYNQIADMLVLTNFEGRLGNDLMSTAYHEAWHRVQFRLLSEKDMNILDSAWGRAKLARLDDNRPKLMIESQAVAFQNYAELRSAYGGSKLPKDEAIEVTLRRLDREFPLKDGRLWKDTIRGKALRVLSDAFEAVADTIDRLRNLASGNGYRTVYDLFEDAYQGRLSGKRKNVNYEAELATILEEKFNKGDWENISKEDQGDL